jgi:hypothetical protein
MTRIRENTWVRRGRRMMGAALLVAVLLPVQGVVSEDSVTAAHGSCQTPFLVYTDPANPGMQSQSGDIAITRDSGLLGEYGGDGRFAGYDINGSQSAIVNTTTGMARVQGEFTATSPDGGSSIDVSYTGQVDFVGGVAMGNFVAVGSTGADAGYRAAGTIEGTVVGPATLDGADVGLC